MQRVEIALIELKSTLLRLGKLDKRTVLITPIGFYGSIKLDKFLQLVISNILETVASKSSSC